MGGARRRTRARLAGAVAALALGAAALTSAWTWSQSPACREQGDAEDLRTALAADPHFAVQQGARLIGYCDDETPFWGVEVTHRGPAADARASLVTAGCVAGSSSDPSGDFLARDDGAYTCEVRGSRFTAFVDPRGDLYPDDAAPEAGARRARILFVPL